MSGKRVEETGNRYGRWTVLEYDTTYKNGAYWICQCDCGTVRSVSGGNLRNGITKSCGCLYKGTSTEHAEALHHYRDREKEINEIGNRYGRLTVIAKDEEKSAVDKYTWWLCLCDCGKVVSWRSITLRERKNQKTPLSCGCARGDYTGKQYGNLKVISHNRDTDMCECLCSCGNMFSLNKKGLREGQRKACYICQPEREGVKREKKRYGHLTVIRETDKRYKSFVVYLCQCDCGNLCEASYKLTRYADIACEECKPEYKIPLYKADL